jgi:hypothetical protein
MDATSIRQLAQEGRLTEARETFLQQSEDPRADRHQLFERAGLAEELGLAKAAVGLYGDLLKADPDDVDALIASALIYGDLGDVEHEASSLQRLDTLGHASDADRQRLRECRVQVSAAQRAPAQPSEDQPPAVARRQRTLLGAEVQRPSVEPPKPQSADIVRFLHLFSGREDVHARQYYDPERGGGYSPVHEALTVERVRTHLSGGWTLGSYVVRVDRTVTFFLVDLDIARWAIDKARGDLERSRELRRLVHEAGLELAAKVQALGLPLVLEDSGYKGRHLWGFFDEPAPADLVHRFGKLLCQWLRPLDRALTVEFFPKQGQVRDGGLGNLVKLPLGIHRVSGRRGLLLNQEGRPVEDPWALLRTVQRISPGKILEVMGELRTESVGAEDRGTWKARAPGAAEGTAAPTAPFAEADFARSPELATLLARCPVIAKLVGQAREQRRLAHDEQTVLIHTFGHLSSGILAANHLLRACPEVRPHRYLKGPLRGHPISCPKIRHRIPDVTSSVACHCAFASRPEHYPTPLLHLDEALADGGLKEEIRWTEPGKGGGGPGPKSPQAGQRKADARRDRPPGRQRDRRTPPKREQKPTRPPSPTADSSAVGEMAAKLAERYERQRGLNRELDLERRKLAEAMAHGQLRRARVQGGAFELHHGEDKQPRLRWVADDPGRR